ncbi:MAG: hypothetical protein II453_20165 [Alphaproteobacteria bacterium]|nr:hypothetical protein [Alphaproteobacteria bacterium]
MDTSDRRTKRLLRKFGKLDYPHQHYLVAQFLMKNAKREGNYFITLIRLFQKEKENDSCND